MNVVSLFDGMGCGMIALQELGIEVENYFSFEIDKFANQQTKHNFPNVQQMGDVRTAKAKDFPKIDLLIGGSPCQGFSFAGNQLNFDDPRSKLFFEFHRLWLEIKEINPDARFFLENVRMDKKCLKVISDHMGVQPVFINSKLVSAQSRPRYYWTNIRTREEGLFREIHTDIPQPKDRGLVLKDILEDEVDEKYYLSDKAVEGIFKHAEIDNFNDIVRIKKNATIPPTQEKAGCFTAGGNSGGNHSDMDIIVDRRILIPEATKKGFIEVVPGDLFDAENLGSKTRRGRKMNNKANCLLTQNDFVYFDTNYRLRRLTPLECCRLQTVPDWYKWIVSDSQQYKMLGNGWTIEVIKHIFSLC